jgi:mono/diheme cytochrome c family protein
MKRSRATVLLAVAVSPLCGCGNQMMRQPAFTPIESPRGAPPAGAVPMRFDRMPADGRSVINPALDHTRVAADAPFVSTADAAEPPLPPPNLSDNARNEPTPPEVNGLISPIPFNSNTTRMGRTLFLNRCVQCHDPSGHGVGPVGKYLIPAPPDLASPLVQRRTNGALYWHITMGQGKMPGFRTWTTPAERWALAAYVRSLNAARPNAAVSSVSDAPYPIYGRR